MQKNKSFNYWQNAFNHILLDNQLKTINEKEEKKVSKSPKFDNETLYVMCGGSSINTHIKYSFFLKVSIHYLHIIFAYYVFHFFGGRRKLRARETKIIVHLRSIVFGGINVAFFGQ